MEPPEQQGEREARSDHEAPGAADATARATDLLAQQGRWFSRGKFLLLNGISLVIAWFPFTTATPGTLSYQVGAWIPLPIVLLFVGSIFCGAKGGFIEESLERAIATSGGAPPLGAGDYLRGYWVTAAANTLQLDRDGGISAILRVHWFLAVVVFILGAFGVAVLAFSQGAAQLAGVPFLALALGVAIKLGTPKVLCVRIDGAPVPEVAAQRVIFGVAPWSTPRYRVEGFTIRPNHAVDLRIAGGDPWPLLRAAARPSAVWEARRLATSLHRLGIRGLPPHPTDTARS